LVAEILYEPLQNVVLSWYYCHMLLQTNTDRNLKTVLKLPVDSDILTVILDYAYTDCVPQLSAAGIN